MTDRKKVDEIKTALLSVIPNGSDWRDVVRALLEVVEDVRRIAPDAVRLVEGEEKKR